MPPKVGGGGIPTLDPFRSRKRQSDIRVFAKTDERNTKVQYFLKAQIETLSSQYSGKTALEDPPPRVSSPLITGLFRFAFNLFGRSQQKIFPKRPLKPSLFFRSFSVAVNDIHVTKGALFLIAGRLCKDGVSRGGKERLTCIFVFRLRASPKGEQQKRFDEKGSFFLCYYNYYCFCLIVASWWPLA